MTHTEFNAIVELAGYSLTVRRVSYQSGIKMYVVEPHEFVVGDGRWRCVARGVDRAARTSILEQIGKASRK